jgi:uncharacterized oligopeptide transporter (OPT) family protein
MQRLRWTLVALLVVAAVLSVVGNKADSPAIGWLSFAVFAVAVGVYFSWRRSVRAKVFDREAKTTDETRARSDQ